MSEDSLQQNEKWKFASVDVSLFDEAEENANEMTKEEYAKLVNNIRMSGGLSSAISAVKKLDGRYLLFSGHHRLRACKDLSIRQVPCVYADEMDMEEDERIALQLSHNSLHGQDNQGILKRLFAQIHSVDFKNFAHINIDEIKPISTESVSFTPMTQNYNVAFVLYSKDLDAAEELIGDIRSASRTSDVVICADGEETEEQFLKLLGEVRNKYDIRSSHITFAKILELAKLALDHDLATTDNIND